MGWNARLFSEKIIREADNIKWDDIDIHLIDTLWIDGYEKYKISRNHIKRFLEFVQFKTAAVGLYGNVFIESRCIGWTDGDREFIYRIDERTGKIKTEIIERTHFHPLSYFLKKKSSAAAKVKKLLTT